MHPPETNILSPRRAPRASTPSGLIALGGLLLGACSVGEEYVRPEALLPDAWRVTPTADARTADKVELDWWTGFGDPNLDELVLAALTESLDLRIAGALVQEQLGRLGVAESEWYPPVTLSGEVGRNQRSLEVARPLVPTEDRTNDTYMLLAGISWEADLWGRIRAVNEAAAAELLAAEEDRRGLMLSITAAVAVSYIELLHFERRVEIARSTADERRLWLDRFEVMDSGGQVSGVEVAQIRHAYQEVASAVPGLELQVLRKENELSVLLGRNPGRIERGRSLNNLIVPEVPAGLPSELLARRPDIRSREQTLIAAHARINEVRTRYYPSFDLTASYGFSSTDAAEWLQDSASIWDMGLRVVEPLFDWGKTDGELEQAKAKRKQMLARYLQSIQQALLEVENALVSIEKLREQLALHREHIKTLEDYVKIARERYDANLNSSGYLEILDADRNLYRARGAEADAQRDLLIAIARGYRAMGGGWDAQSRRAAVMDVPIKKKKVD